MIHIFVGGPIESMLRVPGNNMFERIKMNATSCGTGLRQEMAHEFISVSTTPVGAVNRNIIDIAIPHISFMKRNNGEP